MSAIKQLLQESQRRLVEREEAYARGVAAERARVVADLRALGIDFALKMADRYERGEHDDKEGGR